jgi:hypothetical protein
VNLFYYILDSNGNSLVFGVGDIPNNDLTGDGNSKLVLNTNTADNPNFVTLGGSGIVAVEFTRFLAGYVSRNTGTSTITFGGPPSVTLKTEGVGAQSTALASGTIVGFPISLYGFIGANHAVQLTITKGP